MSEMKHTPTPWTQYMHGPMIHGADGFYIGIMQGKNADKDAAYIVECVNSHASLVEEVERLRGMAQFLIERLDDFEHGSLPETIEDACRDFDGHVSPAIERLRAELKDGANV